MKEDKYLTFSTKIFEQLEEKRPLEWHIHISVILGLGNGDTGN